MDVLTQYYNEAGQIISRTPDLSTREFYRDVVFRHRWKEMFVADKESSGLGYSIGANSILLGWNGNYSGLPLIEQYKQPWSVPVISKSGKGERKCLTTLNSSSFFNLLATNVDNFLAGKGLTFEVIAKSTTPQNSDTIFFELNGSAFIGDFGCRIYWWDGGSNFTGGSVQDWRDENCLVKDIWYTFNVSIGKSGDCKLMVNGETVKESTLSRSLFDSLPTFDISLTVFNGVCVDSCTVYFE